MPTDFSQLVISILEGQNKTLQDIEARLVRVETKLDLTQKIFRGLIGTTIAVLGLLGTLGFIHYSAPAQAQSPHPAPISISRH